MKTVLTGFAVLALASPVAMVQAQSHTGHTGPRSAQPACYLQVSKLVADSPDGVEGLSDALRRLDAALRPQVEEIRVLEAQLERIELRQSEALHNEEADADMVALQADAQRITVELEEKRTQLKQDYAAQRAVLVGPVQTRVSERARAFAAERGCGELTMARAGDLEDLQAESARDMTMAFVAWYRD